MAFPASLPSYTITAGAETANGAAGGLGLSGLLNAFEVDITALGAKLGTGASTPTASKVLRATGTGTSAWGQVVMATDLAAFSSADLAGVISDETGSGKLVFGTSPTIVTPTIASFANATHAHTNAAGGGQLDGSVAILAATLTAAQMQYGMVRQRQGGTTGDATWQTGGTSNTDTSAKAVFIQAGVGTIATAETTVTFPVAFSQPPVVIGAPNSAISQNSSFRARLVTATNFVALLTQNSTAATPTTSETFAWIAIGQ